MNAHHHDHSAWEPESSLGHAPDMIHELFTDLLGRARAAVDDYDDLPLAMKSSLLSVDRFKSSLQTGIIYAASAQRIRMSLQWLLESCTKDSSSPGSR